MSVLSEQELRTLTRRERPTAQARVLRELGIPFTAHPVDRVLLVDSDAVRERLGANDQGPAGDVQWAVNVTAIRGRRGKGEKVA